MSSQDTPSRKIQNAAKKRGIRFLLHFTFTQNLPNIVRHGIQPREFLNSAHFDAYVGTAHRLDRNDKAVSLSISAASPKTIAAKLGKSALKDRLLLFLDPKILWTLNCEFCFQNAATRRMLDNRGFIGGPWAFEKMFSDQMAPPNYRGTSYRVETNVPAFVTTDPDAEVRVIGMVPSDHIVGAWLCRNDNADAVQMELNALPGHERDVLIDGFDTSTNGYSEWLVPPILLRS